MTTLKMPYYEDLGMLRIEVWDAIRVAHASVRARQSTLPMASVTDRRPNAERRLVAVSDGHHDSFEEALEWARSEARKRT